MFFAYMRRPMRQRILYSTDIWNCAIVEDAHKKEKKSDEAIEP